MFKARAKDKPAKEAAFSDRKQRFYDFLKQNPIGVLSTVTPDGNPHGVVIYFTVDENFVVTFITKAETRKHENLKFNSHVALTVFEPKSQATVQYLGVAEPVPNSYDVNGIAGAILATSLKTSDAGLPPISKVEAGSYVGYRIIPTQIRMAVYARPNRGEYTDIFESIESFELDNDHY